MTAAGPAFYRDLWGPAYDPHDRYPMSGDDVVAVKRVLSRAGYLPWTQFTNTYGPDTEKACAAFQADVGIRGDGGGPPRGHYGSKTHEELRAALRAGGSGEWAWDDYSTQLYRQAIVPNTPPSFAFARDLWGPGYDPHERYPMSGDDCLAVKRALSRAGFIGWQQFTNVYGTQAEDGCRAFQQAVGIKGDGGGPPRGHYGASTHKKLLQAKAANKDHQWAFDDYSIQLYKGYRAPSAPTGSKRDTIVSTAKLGVSKAPQIHYTQDSRRMQGVREQIRPQAVPSWEDCSSFATWTYWVAGAPAPNGRGYDGYGYTGTLVENGKRIPVGSAQPGDLIFYGTGWGSTSHVVICIGGGRCVSHGSEGGPYNSDIYYRADIVGAISYL